MTVILLTSSEKPLLAFARQRLSVFSGRVFLTVPVRTGRALASIVEVAAMNNRYRYYGHNAAAELASRVDAVAEGKQLDFGQDYPAEPKRDSK